MLRFHNRSYWFRDSKNDHTQRNCLPTTRAFSSAPQTLLIYQNSMYSKWYKNGIFFVVCSLFIGNSSVRWNCLVESSFFSNIQYSSSTTHNPRNGAPTFFTRSPSNTEFWSTTINGGDNIDDDVSTLSVASERRNVYLQSLYRNLKSVLDEWIISGSKVKQQSAYNILEQIQQHEQSNHQAKEHMDSYNTRAQRLIQRAGLQIPKFIDAESIRTECCIRISE
jgi:hypothetical protein